MRYHIYYSHHKICAILIISSDTDCCEQQFGFAEAVTEALEVCVSHHPTHTRWLVEE